MALIETPKLPPLMALINGKYTYLTTYKNEWDPEKRQPRRVQGQNKTVGKIAGGGAEGLIIWKDDFIAEYPLLDELDAYRVKVPKKKNDTHKKAVYKIEFKAKDEMISLTESVNLRRLSAGATWTLSNIVADTPLATALRRVFNEYYQAEKILSIAFFLYLTSNSATHRYENFAYKHRMPFRRPMDSSQVSRLFHQITPDKIDRFLKQLNALTDKEKENEVGNVNTYYALDSTSISTHSKNLTKAQWGHNKDGDALKQVNVLMMVNQETSAPVYYRAYTGNTPDVSTVVNVIREFYRLNMNRHAIIVSDKGYSSIKNINKFLLSEVGFVLNVKTNYSFAKSIIAKNLTRLDDSCSYNHKACCNMCKEDYMWSYPTYDKTPTGRAVKDRVLVHIHLYLDKNIRASEEAKFTKNIIHPILAKLQDGTALTADEQELKDKYLIDEADGTFSTNHKAKAEYMMDKGIRVLVSNEVSDSLECWRAYYERERIEESFKCMKQTVGGSRFRTAKDETTEGKIFVTFIATAIGMMFRQRVNRATIKGMKLPYDSDDKLLDKLDTIEQTLFKNGGYYSEVTGVPRMILEALDIPVPTTERFDSPLEDDEEVDDDIRNLEEIDESLRLLEQQS